MCKLALVLFTDSHFIPILLWGLKERRKIYNCPSFIVIKYPSKSKFWEVISSGLSWQQALKRVNARMLVLSSP